MLPADTRSHWQWYQSYVHVRLTVTGVCTQRKVLDRSSWGSGFGINSAIGPVFGFEQGRSNTSWLVYPCLLSSTGTSDSSRHIAGGNSPPPRNFKSPSRNFCWCKFLNVPALLADTAVFRCLFKKCCRQVRFSSLKYTKMRMRLRLGPQWGTLQSSQTP